MGVLLVVAACLAFYFDYKNDNVEPKAPEKVATEDAKKFKQEYESLNGNTAYADIKYLNLSISEYSTVTYKTDTEIVDILKKGTGVIYFGFNSCPWCRSMVETLLKVVEDNEIENFYYTDIKAIRSKYEVKKK